MTSVQAPVGVILLDDVYLIKEWPVKELRRILELLTNGQVRVLPVMYNIKYSDLRDLIRRLSDTDSTASKGASRDDAAMLEKLERITMIHSNTSDVVRIFWPHPLCLTAPSMPGVHTPRGLTCLLTCQLKTPLSREHETNFVANVLNAVKYVCDKRNFRSLSRRDADMAKEWLGDLSSLYRQMQRVRALVCRKCITAVSPYDALYTNTPLSLAQCTCQLQTPR